MQTFKKDKKIEFWMFAVCLPCFVLALILCALFVDQSVLESDQRQLLGNITAVSAILSCVVFGFYLYKTEQLNEKNIVILVFVVGFFLRLAYAFEYSVFEHQHDVEGLNSEGHLSYINNLALGNGLPQSNEWQYSHPPLHHFLASLVVKMSVVFGASVNAAFENIQYLTVIYSTLILFASFLCFKELNLKGKYLVLATIAVAVHPIFMMFSGSINNDCLATLFSILAILFLLKWWNSQSFINALFIGLFIGLGMMTKFSSALFIPVVALAVVVKLIFSKSFKVKSFILQTLTFLAVSLPLGLWYQIRNLVLFNQPIGYVAPLSTDSELYTGSLPFFERLVLPFSTKSVGIYVDVWEEYNLWSYILRNSLFGEYQIGNPAFAVFLIIFNALLIILSVVSFVMIVLKFKDFLKSINLCVIIALAVQVLFFIYFNAKYPFGCSMDFRYIPLTAVLGIYLLAHTMSDKKQNTLFERIATVCLVGFSAFSVLTYI